MSIKAVAQMAGVSIATVSRYFNKPALLKKQTYDQVEKAIQTLNYQPNTLAQNFRRGKSGLIIVVVYNIGDPLYENLTQTINPIAESKGYDILIKETNQKNIAIKYYQDMLSGKQVDGLIVMVDLPQTDVLTQSLLNKLPIVFVKETRNIKNQDTYDVELDNFSAAETATQHLIDLKHTSIACLTADSHNIANTNRQKGYSKSLKEADIQNQYIFKLDENGESINHTVSRIIQNIPTITAIFCTQDDIAIKVLSILKQKNIEVPQQISVIGFNNIRYSANTYPPLTTIEQPFDEITQQSIKNLCDKVEKLNNPSPTHPVDTEKNTFKHRLILRSSTSYAPF